MKRNGYIIVASVVLLAGAGVGVSGYYWSVGHVRRWTGRQDVGFARCDYCHLVSTNDLHWAKPRPHHPAPAGMAVSPDGQRLYVALDDMDEVVEVDVSTRNLTRRTAVFGGPFGLTLSPAGDRLYVVCRNDDRLAVLDAQTLKELESADVGLLPTAVAWCRTKAGDRLVVANSGSSDASILSVTPLKELSRLAAGREPYAVASSADGTLAYVVNRLAVTLAPLTPPFAELTVVDPGRLRVVSRLDLKSAHLSEGVAAVPGRQWVLAPLVKVRNLIPITQVANGWVMSSGVAVCDAANRIVQMPLDEAQDYFADPSGIAVDREGRRAYIVSGGSDVVSVLDLERMAGWLAQADGPARQQAIDDLSLAAGYVLARIPTGRNPRQVTLSPEGKLLFVAERLEDTILVVDTATLKPVGRVVLGDGGSDDPIRRGERVFTKAAHTFQRQFSCRSCHPDSHMDGLSYDFDSDGVGDNLLDNRSLQGVDGTEPFKWNGKNPNLEIQCGPRFARVLMRTDPIPPEDLKDLTTFIKSQPPARTVHASLLDRPLTSAQQRGRELFFATRQPNGTPIPRERQCHTCHRPPLFTNHLRSGVGTRGPRDTTDQFDTPHLLGIAASAPYLHDGRAKTLEELWTTYQTNDLHGVSSYMNKHMLNDLVEYLKTL
jgi:DNA-binding beta-propeller fold protein YncE